MLRMVERGDIDPDEVIVAFITGAGLKTQEAVTPVLSPALNITPDIGAFEEALTERTGALPAGRNG